MKKIICQVLMITIYLLASSSNSTAVQVFDWELIHMNVNNGQKATDLHFTLWQKENNIEILAWDYRLQKQAIDGGGLIKEAVGNSGLSNDAAFRTGKKLGVNNLNHAANINIDGFNIEYCKWVWLRTSLELSDWNTLHKRDLKWTFDGNTNPNPPDSAGLPPEEGFSVSNYENDPNNPGKLRVIYTIANDDPSRWFKVQNLRFLIDSFNTPINDPEAMLSWSGYKTYTGGAFELSPGSEKQIIIDNLDARNWLYFALDKQEISGSNGTIVGDPFTTVQIHEVVPEPSTFVLLVFGLAGFWMFKIRKSRV